MNGAFGNLRLHTDGPVVAAGTSAEMPALPDPVPRPDPAALANRELIRPPTYNRGHRHLQPFSEAWFEELERKRYARHGCWLSAALEFGRHPGESVLMIHPGIGSDACRYLREGSEVTVAATPTDHPDLIRTNLARHGLTARIVPATASALPLPDGTFDVAVVNALHTAPDLPPLADELYRVLKARGKVIGLFPAHYDAGYWQDLFLPYQHLYWRRPPDPTSAPKTTTRQLKALFARFADHRIGKRHLRRSELPHFCRVLPLAVLERLFGRVLVLKAFKPITARTATMPALPSDSLAA